MDFERMEKGYFVHVYETGPDGKLALFSLFDYLQDIASEHAVKLGYGREDLIKQNHFWVLSRIYAVITEMPAWEDTLTIKTWPRGIDKLFAIRDYTVRFSDGRPAAAATSSWLIIDQTTRKIQRPEARLTTFNSGKEIERSLDRNSEKINPALPGSRQTPVFSVRVSDLDVNLHTNNARYLKWVSDSYDLGFIMNHVPYSAEINYLAESRFNENIFIRVSEEENDCLMHNHSIIRADDETELCRIRIGWRKKES